MKLKIIRQKAPNDELILTLTGGMTVYSAVRLKQILVKELGACSGLTLNLAEVDEADTSGFQLLLFLKREAGLLGKSFKVTDMSRRLKSIFTLYRETI